MRRHRVDLERWHRCAPVSWTSSANVGDSKIIVCKSTRSVSILSRFHIVDRHRLGHFLVRPLVETLLNRIKLFLNLVLKFLLNFPVDPVLLIFEILKSKITAGVAWFNQIILTADLDETAMQLLSR